jgi:xanthine phosphoribosyltransferase
MDASNSVPRSWRSFTIQPTRQWNTSCTARKFLPKSGMATHYYTVTWDQLHRDARALAWRLMSTRPYEGIVAVTRGGLIPAAIIARELDVRLVESVSIVTYQEEERGQPQVTKPPVAAGDGTGFLIIDDLVDSGTTARVVRGLLPKAHFACIYAKPAGREMVDSFITEVSQDTWILFPWDTEPQFVPPLARRGPN